MPQRCRASRLRLRVRFLLPAAGLIACGTEPPPPGTLTIVLDEVPAALAVTSLPLTGTVTRMPTLTVPIVVRAVGGAAPVEAVAGAGGTFALSVALTPNTVSSITVTADDSTGSTSDTKTVQVRQDSRGPNIVSVLPANLASNVSPTQPIVVTFDEAIDPSHLDLVEVRRGGLVQQRVITVATDSLAMTVTPSVAAAGALYQFTINGVRDVLGNVQGALAGGCYTTAPPAGASAITDPQDDWYYAGQVGGITPSDFLNGSFSLTAGGLDVLVRFTTPRTVRVTATNTLFAALDLDFDLSQATGYRPIKDIAFAGVLPASGAGADYAIWLGPWLGDSSIYGQYTAEGALRIDDAFVPASCGTTIGFTVDNALLGAPLTFNLVGYFETSDANGAYGDAGPDAGVYPVTLPTAAVSTVSGPVPGARGVRPERVIRLAWPRRFK